MITQCAVRTPQGILPVDAPGTVAQAQDACAAAGADYHDAEVGFLTQSGVFMSRTSATLHAHECGQLRGTGIQPGHYLSWSDLVS